MHKQVNAIMDLMAALALATELPTPDMLLRQPYGRYDHLVNGHMWRNIFTQAAYQVPSYCILHEPPRHIHPFVKTLIPIGK
jgi:magnesium-transporting ATPase (P-type)